MPGTCWSIREEQSERDLVPQVTLPFYILDFNSCIETERNGKIRGPGSLFKGGADLFRLQGQDLTSGTFVMDRTDGWIMMHTRET